MANDQPQEFPPDRVVVCSQPLFSFHQRQLSATIRRNGGEETVGNVGGLPELKVYALKFGIHVGRGGLARGHYGNSTA